VADVSGSGRDVAHLTRTDPLWFTSWAAAVLPAVLGDLEAGHHQAAVARLQDLLKRAREVLGIGEP
jgi:hypothetical protein